jgi:hypothetical protein
MSDGQLAINTASGSPGLFIKNNAGQIVKIGPVHVGSTAPNASPASGGTTGHAVGEQWLDNAGGTYVFKVWDGTDWRSEAGEFVNSTGDTMTGSLTMGSGATLIFEGSVDDGFETVLTVVNPTADQTITLPNITGTVITTGDTGTITSTMLLDGTIVNEDVNASAAIAGTKISPNFGSQTIQTTGIISAAAGSAAAPSIAFTGDTNTGIYSPGADQVAISTNGTGRLIVGSTGTVNIVGAGTAGVTQAVSFNGSAPVDSLVMLSDGKVGLGTSSPLTRLHIQDNTTPTFFDTTIDNTLFLNCNPSGGAVNGAFGASIGFSRLDSVSRVNAAIAIKQTTADIDQCGLSFFTHSASTTGVALAESVSITHDGKVGIGTTSPWRRLEVVETTNNTEVARFTNSGGSSGSVRGIGYVGFGIFNLENPGAYIGWDENGLTGFQTELTFGTRANSDVFPTERLRITSAGNVGIGTISPQTYLDITQAVDLTSGEISGNNRGTIFLSNSGTLTQAEGTLATGIAFTGTSSTTRRRALIASYQSSADSDQTGLKFFVRQGTSTASDLLAEAVSVNHVGTTTLTAATSTAPFIANIGASEVARIDSSGRLLVGTSTSVSQFGVQPQIQSTGISGAGGYLGLTVFNTSADSAPNLVLGHSKGGSVGTYTASVANDLLGEVTFTAANGTDMRRGALIGAYADGGWGTNDHPGRLVFSTTADGATNPTEALRISSDQSAFFSGRARFGASSGYTDTAQVSIFTSAAVVGCTFDCGATSLERTHVSFENSNGIVGTIKTSGSATSYNTSSDYRLKENVVPLTGAIDRLQQIPVHRFNFIADPDTVVDGFIAHEAQEIVPECVTGTKDEVDADGNPVYQGIDQSKLVPLLTAALQEALTEIDSLKARVTALEA